MATRRAGDQASNQASGQDGSRTNKSAICVQKFWTAYCPRSKPACVDHPLIKMNFHTCLHERIIPPISYYHFRSCYSNTLIPISHSFRSHSHSFTYSVPISIPLYFHFHFSPRTLKIYQKDLVFSFHLYSLLKLFNLYYFIYLYF
jgi:hypothetical protein